MQLLPATYQTAAVVTKSDSTALNFRAVFCGGAGNLRVTTRGGEDVLFTGVIAGQIIPIEGTKIWSTNTTTTNMVILA